MQNNTVLRQFVENANKACAVAGQYAPDAYGEFVETYGKQPFWDEAALEAFILLGRKVMMAVHPDRHAGNGDAAAVQDMEMASADFNAALGFIKRHFPACRSQNGDFLCHRQWRERHPEPERAFKREKLRPRSFHQDDADFVLHPDDRFDNALYEPVFASWAHLQGRQDAAEQICADLFARFVAVRKNGQKLSPHILGSHLRQMKIPHFADGFNTALEEWLLAGLHAGAVADIDRFIRLWRNNGGRGLHASCAAALCPALQKTMYIPENWSDLRPAFVQMLKQVRPDAGSAGEILHHQDPLCRQAFTALLVLADVPDYAAHKDFVARYLLPAGMRGWDEFAGANVRQMPLCETHRAVSHLMHQYVMGDGGADWTAADLQAAGEYVCAAVAGGTLTAAAQNTLADTANRAFALFVGRQPEHKDLHHRFSRQLSTVYGDRVLDRLADALYREPKTVRNHVLLSPLVVPPHPAKVLAALEKLGVTDAQNSRLYRAAETEYKSGRCDVARRDEMLVRIGKLMLRRGLAKAPAEAKFSFALNDTAFHPMINEIAAGLSGAAAYAPLCEALNGKMWKGAAQVERSALYARLDALPGFGDYVDAYGRMHLADKSNFLFEYLNVRQGGRISRECDIASDADDFFHTQHRLNSEYGNMFNHLFYRMRQIMGWENKVLPVFEAFERRDMAALQEGLNALPPHSELMLGRMPLAAYIGFKSLTSPFHAAFGQQTLEVLANRGFTRALHAATRHAKLTVNDTAAPEVAAVLDDFNQIKRFNRDKPAKVPLMPLPAPEKRPQAHISAQEAAPPPPPLGKMVRSNRRMP